MTTSPRLTKLDSSVFHMLRRAEQYAADLYSEEVGQKGLTPRQFTALLAINQHEGVSQTELVEKTGIDRSTLADLVARLGRKGLIQRRRTKEDARANSIRLSAAGRRALLATNPAAARVNRRLLATIPNETRKNFLVALEDISKALAKAANGAASKHEAPAKTKRKRTAK